jgi:mRNA interferase MazF
VNDPGFLRGDLVIVVFGGDYGKPRPAVVAQTDAFNATHSSIALCPVSSEITGLNLFRVFLRAAETPGLREDSEVMVDMLRAVERRRVRQRVGQLSREQMGRVDAALRIWLDLPKG